MAEALFRAIPNLFVCLVALSMTLSSYISFPSQGVQKNNSISIKTLGPVILQEPSLEVAAVLPLALNDVWIAGSYSPTISQTVPLYEHFDGVKWIAVPNPDVGAGGTIRGLSAQSPHDIWAVGAYRTNPNNPIDLPLIEHWNGSHWSMINQNYSGTFATGSLISVAALSANNVWMVGTQRRSVDNPSTQTFIEHWDGSQIHTVASPNPAHTTSNYLKAITASSANDVWSVGISDTGNTLTEHWDGSQWTIIASPNITFNQGIPNFNLLTSASLASKSDVWAIGLFNTTATSFKGALAEHWNGIQWSITSLSNLPGDSQELSAITSPGTNDSWALGTTTTNNKVQPLLTHWDGTAWKIASLPPSLSSLQYLQTLTSSPTTLVSISKDTNTTNTTRQLVLLQKNY
jgi:hypothetical protein